MNQLRRNPITEEWVIIGDRIGGKQKFSFKRCPFCYGNEEDTPDEIYRLNDAEGNWLVRVIPDKYPVLQIEGDIVKAGEGVYDIMSGIGAHEIIVECPLHNTRLAAMSETQILNIFKVWQHRITELKKDDRFRCVSIFRNEGQATGIFINHPYSQVVATPFVPLFMKRELKSIREYYKRKERCLMCDCIRQDLSKSRERIIRETSDFICVAPFASCYSYEAWIMPKYHSHAFEANTDDNKLSQLAGLLSSVLLSIENALVADPSYTLALFTSPNEKSITLAGEEWSTLKDDFHWHIKIMPVTGPRSGFERGSDIHTNPVSPEEAAAVLRSL